MGCASHPHGHAEGGHHPGHMEKRFQGADAWAKVFDDPERDAWQKPETVIDALTLTPDMVVADIGAGTGYFTMRIAKRVPKGAVLGVDVEPDMVRYIGDRAEREGLANVRPTLAVVDDARLPVAVDRVLVVDTYHHIAGREAYFVRLREKLMPGARVAIVDFTKESPVGPPADHRIDAAQVEKEMASAGYELLEAPAILPNQYMLLFTPRTSR